jgi:putative oxidoreductase
MVRRFMSPERSSASQNAFRLIAIAYALFWLWSGVAKMKDPAAFAIAVRNFRLLGDPWVAAAALFIPSLEIVCAVAIVIRLGAKGALGILWLSLVVFTVAIAISWARGLDIECGCFGVGDGRTVHYPVKLAQNFALLAMGGWLWWREAAKSLDQPNRPLPSPT